MGTLRIDFPCLFVATSSMTACAAAPGRVAPPLPAAPTGDVHDFDYFAGAWTTQQRRLEARGVGSTEWDTFPAQACTALYLGGTADVGEMVFPTKGWAGVTVRSFDIAQRRWAIRWINSKTGTMDPGVVGGFAGSHGVFYGEDEDDGHRVAVRYVWDEIDHDHARWEQAFSWDGATWEVNWTADFTRADPALCDGGRLRHVDAPQGKAS